ncbi:flagellar hook-associated protein 1 FlgK [Thiogranum longum]|uniref:Flagellar hook-associated protein 1 n=1 Tax=Thiogranum longum TaxID=1537524 RepID=A0A4R1HNL7_9GAMM|nr:flagellar hook-associated protein FlgK [Thiogranum longum]TCK18862.1 flagellar hook-associated protein 1 FlgK [Thiogranum longum]
MAVGLLGTATSGLQAFQRSIATTGNNISNANTEGYSRQRVELGTRPPSFTGQGFMGNGVQIESVTRLFDQFTADRLRDTTSTSAQYDTLFQYASRVSNLLGDSDAGLSAGLENFFSSMQDLADNPSAIPPRQLVLSEAGSLVGRIQNLSQQLDSMRSEINGGLDTVVNEINSLSTAIADTNRNILDARSQGAGQTPNDLLDKRDMLINELSGLVSVRTFEQDDGSVNVFVGSGQSLVTGFLASPLQITRNGFDARRSEISVVSGGIPAEITSSLTGGKLGALLDFREQTLNTADNALGRIAVTFSTEFNLQQNLGMDLDGEMGVDMFSVSQPSTSAHINNTGSASVVATFDTANIQDLTTSDYVLAFDGATWNLSRAIDGLPVAMTGAGTAASPFNAQGLDFVVSGAPAAGDRFEIKPTREGSSSMSLLIGDPGDIAAAAPLTLGEATNANGLPTNVGDGAFRLQAVDSTFTPLVAGITFTYDAGTQQFNYAGDVAGSFAYDPVTDSGSTFTVAGTSFIVNGAPADGDSFVAAANTNGSGDNFNALLLAGLQAAKTMENGDTSFQGAYGQLISDLGARTRSAEITSQAQAALKSQAQESRDALSGVNLDEEAADLIRFQQAYSAIAQVISVAESTFQTLLAAVGR